MHRNMTIHEDCTKFEHINFPYNKNAGVSGERRICGHLRQNGNNADASLWCKKLSSVFFQLSNKQYLFHLDKLHYLFLQRLLMCTSQ